MSQQPPPQEPGWGQQSGAQWGQPAGAPDGQEQYGGPSSEDRTWAVCAHLGALVTAWFAFGFIAPLLVLLLRGNASPFVRRHALESLNFQISMLIYSVVGAVLAFVIIVFTLGLGALLVIPILLVILLLVLAAVIVASVKASNSEDYRYPCSIRFIS